MSDTKQAAKSANRIFTQEDVMRMLDTCYSKVLTGIGKASPPVEKMAEDYRSKAENSELAAQKMIRTQIIKCTTSGFLTGFGGIITLPVSIPANIGSVLYVQMRMIACTAYLAGYDLKSDQVQTLVYACLAGVSVNQIIKRTSITLGQKVTINLIKKIPGSTLTKINQRVGFRFLTKFGQKGLINLGKLTPGIGALIGGGLDLVETKAIGNRAFHWFFRDNYFGDGADASESEQPSQE